MIVPKKIIISRTDAIGDVILTLPMCGVLKEKLPGVGIIFLGRSYTKPVIDACANVDSFMNWDDVSKMTFAEQKQRIAATKADCIVHVFPNKDIAQLASGAGIKQRIGTTNRLFHWWTCNKLVRLSRKNSDKHEAQLNLELLEPISGKQNIELNALPKYYGLTKVAPLPSHLQGLLDFNKLNVILHTKSKGSAREWSLDNFSKLIHLLPPSRFKIFLSGTKDEGALLKDFIAKHESHVTDITGKMSLAEFIAFINAADGLVACSTGPLHIASALGKHAVGLYPSMRPIFPQRWAPIGINASYLSKNISCNDCRATYNCHCLNEITPEQVYSIMQSWQRNRGNATGN